MTLGCNYSAQRMSFFALLVKNLALAHPPLHSLANFVVGCQVMTVERIQPTCVLRLKMSIIKRSLSCYVYWHHQAKKLAFVGEKTSLISPSTLELVSCLTYRRTCGSSFSLKLHFCVKPAAGQAPKDSYGLTTTLYYIGKRCISCTDESEFGSSSSCLLRDQNC